MLVCYHFGTQHHFVRLPCQRDVLPLAHAVIFPCCAIRIARFYLFLQNAQWHPLKDDCELLQWHHGIHRTALDDGGIYPLRYHQAHLPCIRGLCLHSVGGICFSIPRHDSPLPYHPVLPSEDALDVRKEKIIFKFSMFHILNFQR